MMQAGYHDARLIFSGERQAEWIDSCKPANVRYVRRDCDMK